MGNYQISSRYQKQTAVVDQSKRLFIIKIKCVLLLAIYLNPVTRSQDGSGSDSGENLVTAMLQYWVEQRKEDATSEELQNALKILSKITSPAGEEDPKTETTETIAATNDSNEVPTVAVNLQS